MLAPPPTGDDPQTAAAAAATGSVAGPPPPATAAPARPGPAVYRLLRNPWLWAGVVLISLAAGGFVLARPHVLAWYHLRAARWELQHYHNPQAVRDLQVCLSVWPQDPAVLLPAARAARRAHSYNEAERLLEVYQKARGLDEASTREQLLLAAERRVDQVADRCWRDVEDGRPDAPLLLEALATGYMRQFRLTEARLCLDHWLQSDPNNAQALYLEGLFYLDFSHAREAAEVSYRRAVECDPDHEEARLGLAVTLLDKSNYAEAAEHLERLRRVQPDNLSVTVGLAECRANLGQEPEAVRLVDDVLARQPEHTPALSLRGRLALKANQPEQAEPYLREAIKQEPSNHRTLYSLIQCLRQNGQIEEADRRQQDLLQLEKDLARFNDIATKEMLQRPRDPALHCELGQLLLRGGHEEEGLHWLQSALRIDPHYAPARQALSDYQKKVKAKQQPAGSGQ
jgi:tetratricopeptide (TPR) repeat protein